MEILWFMVMGALVAVPLFKLLPHYGLNAWWALAALFPVGLVILLWVMAARTDG